MSILKQSPFQFHFQNALNQNSDYTIQKSISYMDVAIKKKKEKKTLCMATMRMATEKASTCLFYSVHSIYLILSSAEGISSSFSIRFWSCLNVVSTANVIMHCFPSDVDSRTFLSVRLAAGCVGCADETWLSSSLLGLVWGLNCWGLATAYVMITIIFENYM